MITEREKEELFTDFALRLAQEDKEDKKLSVRMNNSAMKKVSRYYDAIEIGTEKQDRYGIYDCYQAIRKVIPLAVGLKHRMNGDFVNDPRYNRWSYCKSYVLEPGKDDDEAEEIGKLLLDALKTYVEGSK